MGCVTESATCILALGRVLRRVHVAERHVQEEWLLGVVRDEPLHVRLVPIIIIIVPVSYMTCVINANAYSTPYSCTSPRGA